MPALAEPAALVARLQRGDEAALRTLVDALWRPLVSYATWLLDDADAASDVVQDALSHVWLTRDNLAIRTSLETYLYRAVHNRALDERRRTTRRRRLLERRWLQRELECDGVVAPAEPLPAILEQALASLPERRRQVFILAHLHDLTYREIAQILDLSPQTIANHVSMALADLRRKLASHAAEFVTQDEVALRHDYQPTSAS
jgi:RNA polymerase sigma-70 factor (ECF subfamily)